METKRQDFDLYFNGNIVQFENGQYELQREKITYDSSEPDLYHTVLQGDNLTYIAWLYYKNHTTPTRAMRYWKYIADVNDILNPLDISSYIGSRIVIPNFNLCKLSE